MFYKLDHGRVILPAPMLRTFRKRLTMRVRASTSTSNHVFRTHSTDIKKTTPRTETNLTSLVRQFVSQIGEWWTPTKETTEDDDELTMEEMTQQLQTELENSAVELNEESVSELAKASRPNIWKFLQPVPTNEVQESRFMASLSHASYYLSRLTSRHFLNRYGLKLVTTSLKCKQPARDAKLVDEALESGDGMAVGQATIPVCEEKSKVEAMEMSNIVVGTSVGDGTDVLNDMSSENWNMGSMANSIYTQSLAQLARQITIAASVSHSAVSVTLTRVMKLLDTALRPYQAAPSVKSMQNSFFSDQVPGSSPGLVAGGVPPPVPGKCPTEWFVCDDAKKETRIFCIQGTDNFESWKTNLQFDPVSFESEELGVRVHRGIYEAALNLYGLFVPLVQDHIKSGRGKKISFTGHSLGGAIATVLMMLMVHRGILGPKDIGKVFTFGGAACFCDGCDCSTCSMSSGVSDPHCSSNQNLFEKLGLPQNTVINVIMHKDIIPRAFASDYSLVADLLRKWSSSFRKHYCLAIPGRTLLYNFIGEILVLQPSDDLNYVNNEGYHPMFPEEAGLFRLADPDNRSIKLAEKLKDQTIQRGDSIGNEVGDKKEAFLALMDNPHPLDILSEARSYGVYGAISRYHNPGNYVLGLRSVMKGNRPKFGIF
eukprot:g5928.t1